MPRIVVGFSYDMDGTVFIANTPHSPNELIKNHANLFAPAKTEKNKKYVFCGSSRQTPEQDKYAANVRNTSLAMTVTSEVAKYLNAIHNTFLFGDIASFDGDKYSTLKFNNYLPGSIYSKSDSHCVGEFSYHDHHKIIIVLSQICNLMIHEQDADRIIFNFYDDDLVVLKGIGLFFAHASKLMQKKVELKLHHYAVYKNVVTPNLIQSIPGTGERAIINYYNLIRTMIETEIKYSYNDNDDRVLIVDHPISKDRIDALYDLGAIQMFSHDPGQGLLDYSITCSEKPMTLLRNSSASEGSTSAESLNDNSTKNSLVI